MSIGIEVKHFSNSFSNKNVIHKMTDNFGESCTDITKWRPDLSIIRAQLASSTGLKKKLLYDFPDGVDTGEYIQTYLRSKGLDITEVDTAEKRILQIIQDKSISESERQEASKVRELLTNYLSEHTTPQVTDDKEQDDSDTPAK